jgi:hypothetical protein
LDERLKWAVRRYHLEVEPDPDRVAISGATVCLLEWPIAIPAEDMAVLGDRENRFYLAGTLTGPRTLTDEASFERLDDALWLLRAWGVDIGELRPGWKLAVGSRSRL